MVCAFYRGGYRYCFNATPHHCAHYQRCGQGPPQDHPNTTLLGFRVALRRRAGWKIKYDAEDGLRDVLHICQIPGFCVWGWLRARLAKRQALAKQGKAMATLGSGAAVRQRLGQEAWPRGLATGLARGLAKIWIIQYVIVDDGNESKQRLGFALGVGPPAGVAAAGQTTSRRALFEAEAWQNVYKKEASWPKGRLQGLARRLPRARG